MTGLVILLPLALTIMIVSFIVNFLTKPFVGLASDFLTQYNFLPEKLLFFTSEQLISYGGQGIILVGLVLATIIIGVLTRWFFINYLISIGEYFLHKIPFINQLYKTTQEIIKTIFHSDSKSFKQVVLVPFPTPKVLSIALVTRDLSEKTTEPLPNDLVSVFVPTTPNPTSGYLLLYRREDITYLDMKVEDAIKFVFSFGMIIPPTVNLDAIIKKANERDQ
ncbi:Uncharacterized protein AB751O23_BB_00030 [Chlamydiales bacterium SCGC AB-751-O23]|nr:Uncharacterized protein AB751O23_BB_00030 [Chlamydiales bacterium SCGC AB-751-O23]